MNKTDELLPRTIKGDVVEKYVYLTDAQQNWLFWMFGEDGEEECQI